MSIVDRKTGESLVRLQHRHAHSYFAPDMIPGLVFFLDSILFVTTSIIAFFFTVNVNSAITDHYIFYVVFTILIYYFLGSRFGLFDLFSMMKPLRSIETVFIVHITILFFLLSIIYSLNVEHYYEISWIICIFSGSPAVISVARILVFLQLRQLSRRGAIGRNVAVLGISEQSSRLLRRLRDANPYFMFVRGVFSHEASFDVSEFEGAPVLGGMTSLLAAARAGQIDEVIVALPWSADQQLKSTIETLKELPINVYLSSDLVGYELAFRPPSGGPSDLPLFEVVQRPISGWAYAVKLVEDYVIASTALILLSPLFILIAIAIKIDSPGPVFFMQKRLGFNNKVFYIYKFRSMYHNHPGGDVVVQARKGDPRVTRVGRILRASSIDEIPQLLNVLDGTMSIVGPRPHALSHNEEYGAQIRGYFARHRVKPGITGWAQVNGLRGETDVIEKMEARIRHDIYYADNWSLFLDIHIIIKTVIVLFFQKTAY